MTTWADGTITPLAGSELETKVRDYTAIEVINRQNADNVHLATDDPHGDRAYGPGVPDGPAITSTLDNIHLPLWFPNRVPIGADGDTFFVPDMSSERQVLADGGMLSGNGLVYDITALKATIGAGRFGASVTQNGSSGSALYPSEGLIALDEFTVECAVNPTADMSTQSLTAWKIVASGYQYVDLHTEAGYLVTDLIVDERDFVPAGIKNFVRAQIQLVTGDVPANTWTVITVRWKASTGILTLTIGNNTKTANSSATPNPAWLTRPWMGGDPKLGTLGMAIAGDRALGGTVTGLRVSDMIIRRYSRTYAQQSFRPRPAITMDAATTVAAWTGREAGVVGHYTGWSSVEASETSTAIRDIQLDMAASAGMTGVRLAEFHLRAIPTISGGAITGISYTALDTHWDRYITRGINKVHCLVGYTPTAFGGSNAVPAVSGLTQAQAFTLYASYVSQVFGHLKTRYPGVIKTISFWNEPTFSGFWLGTQAQLLDLWEAVAAKMETDHPDLPALGGVDEILGAPSVSGTSISVPESNQREIITRSVSSGHPVGALFGHQYGPQTCQHQEAWDALRDYATAASAGLATVPFGTTEWGMINSSTSGADNGISILAQEHPQRQNGEWMAAFTHSFIAEQTKYGATFNYFFRLGQSDTFTTTGGGEEMMGMIGNTGRPWPVFGAFSLLWKHAGNRVTSTPNFPHIHSIATKSAAGVITLTYSSFRPYKPTDTVRFQLSLSGLPATFNWKQWRVDQHEREQGIPTLIAKGNQTNIPSSVEIGALGVGCIQITP